MLDVKKQKENDALIVKLLGKLDTITAPQLEEQLAGSLNGVACLIFDLENLEYISSAGLRVLLSAQKKMNAQGKMKIKKVCENVMEIFEVTGFDSIFDIE